MSCGPLRESRALRVLPSKKVSRGVFYSSTGSGLMSGIDIRDTRKKGANGYEH
jgi:hypothetical protein